MKDKYACIIVDDEPLARRLVANYLATQEAFELKGEFKNVAEMSTFLSSNKIDLIFLDIQMPGKMGIAFLETMEDAPSTIITTAYDEHAVKAFELDVIDYLVKPFSRERFGKAITKFESFYEYKVGSKKTKDFLFVRSSYGVKRFDHQQIRYVVAKKEYMQLQLEDQLPELVYMRMKELQHQLGNKFVRIHKSHLVNIDKIDEVAGDFVLMGEDKVKISRNFKRDLVRKLQQGSD